VDVFSAVVTLFLIMDPLGNIPLFLSVLKVVPPDRRRVVLLREIVLAYLVLILFLLLGRYVLQFLRLEQETNRHRRRHRAVPDRAAHGLPG
jgi:multiple antibiotic resistance protein